MRKEVCIFTAIITPNQTAVTFAEVSAKSIGATIGTTTIAISMKSKKNPKTNITAMTTINCDQNPPGNPVKKFLTISSPPKPLNAAVSIAAPIKIIKTIDVVRLVSSITFFKTLSILKVR